MRLQGLEILRRAYMSVRDANWDTIPARMTNLSVNAVIGPLSDYIRRHQYFPRARASVARHVYWRGRWNYNPRYGGSSDPRFLLLPHRILSPAPAHGILRPTLHREWPGRPGERATCPNADRSATL